MQKEELVRLYGEVLSTSEATEKYEFVARLAPRSSKLSVGRIIGAERWSFSTARDFISTLLKILKINRVRCRRENL